VPLLLQLRLQLHGQPAPLQLLEDVTLTVVASVADGAQVPQVSHCAEHISCSQWVLEMCFDKLVQQVVYGLICDSCKFLEQL